MREVLFRGRICEGIENAGAWVYWSAYGTDMAQVIDRDTVGMWTGLLDENSVKIFEGDVVAHDHEGGRDEGVVQWLGEGTASFNVSKYKKPWEDLSCHEFDGKKTYEVIGNIYETGESK